MQKINFQDLPSTATPLNASNMNAIQSNVEDVFNGSVPMGNVVVEGIKAKNLFNYQQVIGGWLRYSDNTYFEQSTDTFCVSEYIEVSPSTTYTLNLYSATGLNSAGIMEYNSGRTWLNLSIQENAGTIYTFTTSSNTKYIRFTCRQDSKQNVQLERGSSTTSYSSYQGLGYVSGRNANGYYKKYDDGTLIQWNRLQASDQAINSAYGSLYQGVRTITFPIAFVGDFPTCQCSEFQWGTGASWGCVAGRTLTTMVCRGVDVLSRASGTCYISWFAIGRWK